MRNHRPLQVIRGTPPNFPELAAFFPTDAQTCFCYGDTLYTRSDEELPADVLAHEAVHARQQEMPELWWHRYLIDPVFRLDQELEAFAVQYNFVRRHMPRAAKEALFDFADALSGPLYQLDIGHMQAELLIRRRAQA